MQPNGAEVFFVAQPPNGLIANVGDAGQHLVLLYGNSKVAALVRDTTTKKGAVSRIEYGNVGVCHRLPLFIDDSARQVEVGLVNTFHNHHAVGLGDTHGIEPHNLTDGIG